MLSFPHLIKQIMKILINPTVKPGVFSLPAGLPDVEEMESCGCQTCSERYEAYRQYIEWRNQASALFEERAEMMVVGETSFTSTDPSAFNINQKRMKGVMCELYKAKESLAFYAN